MVDSKNYNSIEYEEKFEDIEHVKRICLININRDDILLENINNQCIYDNCTMVVGEDLNLLSIFEKSFYQ